MPRFICKLEEKYFEYSTIVDAIVTDCMSIDEFIDYYYFQYGHGANVVTDLTNRLKRVEMIGTSSRLYDSVEELLINNRNGKDETRLSIEQIKSWIRGDFKELDDIVGKRLV